MDRRSTSSRASFPASHGIAGLALAPVALLAGCAQSAKGATPQPTPTAITTPTNAPTPTPLPPAPLTWRTATLPSGAGAIFAVAPSDAATAYDCQAPDISGSTGPVEPPHIWATHDFAAHWTRMANIPADKLNNQCTLRVDQLNPSIVVAVLAWLPNGAGGGPDIRDESNWVTFNGGGSWRKLTNAQPAEMNPTNSTATRDGMTYAIRSVLRGNAIYTGLWVSGDYMNTWRSIDPPGLGATNGSTFAMTLWISRATGEMIAAYGSIDVAYPPTSLWDTHDGGAHWTQLITPSVASPMEPKPYLAWSPGPHAPLTICNTDVGVPVDDLSSDFPLVCSEDDGKTWNARPNIAPVDAAENTAQEVGRVFAIAGDGSLLASLSGQQVNTLYRLAPGASQWQLLGDVPPVGYTASYYPVSGGGALWTDPAHSAPAIATLRTA